MGSVSSILEASARNPFVELPLVVVPTNSGWKLWHPPGNNGCPFLAWFRSCDKFEIEYG